MTRVLLALTIGWSGVSCSDASDPADPRADDRTSSIDPTGSSRTTSTASSTEPSGSIEVPSGTWGGDHITLALDASGGVAEFDCARGDITEPLRPDARGHFRAAGSYIVDPGGPAQTGDEEPTGVPADYVGTVEGRRMSLTVVLPDHGTRHGPFRLTRGDPGTPESCL